MAIMMRIVGFYATRVSRRFADLLLGFPCRLAHGRSDVGGWSNSLRASRSIGSSTDAWPRDRGGTVARLARLANFVRRRLDGVVIVLKTVTFTHSDGRDLIALKLDRENPIPCAEFQRRGSQPQLAVTAKVEVRVLP
jgi:hypothetical protein